MKTSYSDAIRQGFEYLLEKYPEVFVFGQGVWSPWYVGNTMKDLDQKFGRDRIIDSPVSEWACTGAAVGASLFGMRPIVIHPRMDFMILAADPLVNQAAKWGHMLGGAAYPALTVRSIINRGGEQGAQHSQALHSWYAHIPGLKVVMPATPKDARDLLIASVLSNDPVLYIDDRWLYETEEDIGEVQEIDLSSIKPRILSQGSDITIVGSGYSTFLAQKTAFELSKSGTSAEVIDLRVLNPFNSAPIIESVKKTGRLLCIDGGWKTCGMAGEVISSVVENLDPSCLKSRPQRITLPDCPAPTSSVLEKAYYPSLEQIISHSKHVLI